MTSPHLSALVPDPRECAFAVRDLAKAFDGRPAVQGLSLDVPRGAMYGVVGPNGAGKTTMLTMACGLLRPDHGASFIAGHSVWEDPLPAKAAVGLLMDGAPVFDRLTGAEYLYYLGALRRLPEEESTRRAAQLLQALGLSDAASKPIADYSAGMTKKILLAGALLHSPEVLVLDEPLEAVDPVSGRLIQQMLRSFAARGGTVVLSSHVMSLVEGLCDHVAIIDQGRVVASGHVDEVRDGRSLTDVFVDLVGGGDFDEASLDWLGEGSR
ncbi:MULTISPECIES: ABC transporter ATP-binding protein [Corynebacterium]|uniref:ABC transporter ATP-binding protein n=1 Tax=Corynebacterium phoceense TaxID=1686286 RepID=A0A540R9Z9_9CORY|nr:MULTISPECIES: ABC transporter ATP-binding protein [Corynebacterium]KXB55966.1 daunorubicin/doxorubicin resistance ATP-binding protein DrrA family protein [Corynebacterium sp. DNF00584]MBF9010620.1 ABC transporter ATP-binding protein [Corynebacterium phoceense]MCQ9340222.1 ABC transporter ATP-binding protein [Corynebacterium phoceense]OFL78720.1 ABC transporter ATP-binding protein [Corynebacterium sp. HMSC077B05]OFP21050.1 ABC transporter ATP-binding protein [Corynebacterium sp. HMSC065A05]